ncbi:hypothetical protein [Pseudomonas sp. NA-150]|uniref:hypothetical protein n=1 Tax=Pseudomonas sp. NA-150 TaxID=3367525 RepID=UPI0037C5C4BA
MKKLSVFVLSMCMGLGAVGSAFAAETNGVNPMGTSTMSKDMMKKNSISQNSGAQDNLPNDPAKAAAPTKDDMNMSKKGAMKKNGTVNKDNLTKGTEKKGTMSKDPAKAPVSE